MSPAPLTQSFHVLAALRIVAITEQCKKRGELAPWDGKKVTMFDVTLANNISSPRVSFSVSPGTFDMPTFRCLLRPGDLGAAVLNKSGYVLVLHFLSVMWWLSIANTTHAHC